MRVDVHLMDLAPALPVVEVMRLHQCQRFVIAATKHQQLRFVRQGVVAALDYVLVLQQSAQALFGRQARPLQQLVQLQVEARVREFAGQRSFQAFDA